VADPAATHAVLTVNASAEGAGLPPETTIRSDDPALASLVLESVFASKRELAHGCVGGCTGGALVIVHLPADGPLLEKVVELSATIVPECSGRCARPQIREDADKAFTGKPTTLTTGRVILQRIQVDPGVAERSVSRVLYVDAAALEEPITALRGTIRAAVGYVDGDQRFGTDQAMTVGTIEPFEIDSRARDIDWLGECQAGRECAIPLQLDLRTVEGPATEPSGGSAPPAQADFYDWWVIVTLEAYDLRALPEGAIRIDSE
jgi:hypothetical protein